MRTASALIPAAGSGARLGRGRNKAFRELAGRPILAHTLAVFEACKAVDEVIVVVGEQEIEPARELIRRFGCAKVRRIVAGGAERQDSVANGLREVTGDIVAIHDAARPLVTCEIIERSVEEAERSGACIAAVPVVDTIKSAADGAVTATIDRRDLYAVQTPQTFQTELIREAYARAFADRFYATDDAALVERLGRKVTILPGSYDNIKITTPADLEIARARLASIRGHSERSEESPGRILRSAQNDREVRTGIGYDVHALVEGRKLFLGGVEFEFEKGLAGHSDADVVLHAIMDALLGAASLGDIGRHFPDTDPQYRDVSSLKLLERVGRMLSKSGWRVVNVDAVVICERPKIAPLAAEMEGLVSRCLNVEPARVSIKGTTTEGLGFTGRGEGITCQAVATIAT